ncbi:MAG: hypothetical protein L3K16_06245 [Thermoplasmata archaeon]|nr:hypothetical protein [Thermoplasmata archaeon]
MHWRLFAVAAALILGGSVLVVTPLSQGSVSSTNLDSGQWLDVPVPRVSSWTGSPVDVLLSWGTVYVPRCEVGYYCLRYSPPLGNRTYLLVFDCGPAPCRFGVNYTFVGATDDGTGGNTGFVAIPGDHYQVWLMAETNDSPSTAIPVRFALQTPILGGVFGTVGVAWGAIAAIEAVRRWQVARKGNSPGKAFL